MCSIDGLSEEELLTFFDLFEKSLQIVLRKGAEVVLHDVKTEILTHVVLIDPTITISEIRNPQLTIYNILKRIRSAEALETNITAKASKGLLLSKKPSNGLSQVLNYVDSSMLYEELLHESREEQVVARKLADWVHSLKNLRLGNIKNGELGLQAKM